MMHDHMEEQLEVYQEVFCDPPTLGPLKSHIPNWPDKLAVLLAAIDRHRLHDAADSGI